MLASPREEPQHRFYKSPHRGANLLLAGEIPLPDTCPQYAKEEVEMRLASLITWSVTVLLLLAARGSSTIQTPKEGSASRVDILENAYGLRVLEDKDLYLQAVAEAASKQLVELQKEVFGIRGLRYPPRHPLRYGEQLLWASSSTRSPRRWCANLPPSRLPRCKKNSETRVSGQRSSTATVRTRLRRGCGTMSGPRLRRRSR